MTFNRGTLQRKMSVSVDLRNEGETESLLVREGENYSTKEFAFDDYHSNIHVEELEENDSKSVTSLKKWNISLSVFSVISIVCLSVTMWIRVKHSGYEKFMQDNAQSYVRQYTKKSQHVSTKLENSFMIALTTMNYEPGVVFLNSIQLVNKSGLKPENVDMHIHKVPKEVWINNKQHSDTNFQTPLWFHSIQNKISYLTGKLQEILSGEQEGGVSLKDDWKDYEYIIFSDTDIQYFPGRGSVWDELFAWIDKQEEGIFFMEDPLKGDLNTGFQIIKTIENGKFIKQYSDYLEKITRFDYGNKVKFPLADQSIFNGKFYAENGNDHDLAYDYALHKDGGSKITTEEIEKYSGFRMSTASDVSLKNNDGICKNNVDGKGCLLGKYKVSNTKRALLETDIDVISMEEDSENQITGWMLMPMGKKDLKYKLIPEKYIVSGKPKTLKDENKKTVLLHHAVCETKNEGKIEQMRDVWNKAMGVDTQFSIPSAVDISLLSVSITIAVFSCALATYFVFVSSSLMNMSKRRTIVPNV